MSHPHDARRVPRRTLRNNRRWPRLLAQVLPVVIAVGAALSVVACDRDEPESSALPKTPGNALMTPTRAPAPVVLPDAEIQQVLAARYAEDPNIDTDDFTLTVEDGVVKLAGKSKHLLAPRRAQEIAHATAGVRAFIDLTQQETIDRDDQDIARDVRKALTRDPAADKYEVSVDVKLGEVRLDGWVESWLERQRAERTAMSIAGVRDVENDISVDATAQRSDTDVANDVEALLGHDPRIGAEAIDIKAVDGKVTLSGRVGSDAERIRAVRLAKVGGVDQVIDELEVEPEASDRFRRDPTQLAFDDATLRTSVEAALVRDPRLLGSAITVSVIDGVARLSGVVPSFDAEQAALTDAAATVGVHGVVDGLRVNTAS